MTIAVSVSQASGSKFKVNKNGVLPLVLSALNGVLPQNSGILDGSIASRLGLEPRGQYVLNIMPAPSVRIEGKVYLNYTYTLVTKLGAGFEQMVAQKVVDSMDFGFEMSAPMNAPQAIINQPVEEIGENIDEPVVEELVVEEPVVEEPVVETPTPTPTPRTRA